MDLVGVGFNSPYLEIFESRMQLDPDYPDALVGALLSSARIKAATGKVPLGDITEMFDMARGGGLRKNAQQKTVHGSQPQKLAVAQISKAGDDFLRGGIDMSAIKVKTDGIKIKVNYLPLDFDLADFEGVSFRIIDNRPFRPR